MIHLKYLILQVQRGNLKKAIELFDKAIPLANTELEMVRMEPISTLKYNILRNFWIFFFFIKLLSGSPLWPERCCHGSNHSLFQAWHLIASNGHDGLGWRDWRVKWTLKSSDTFHGPEMGYYHGMWLKLWLWSTDNICEAPTVLKMPRASPWPKPYLCCISAPSVHQTQIGLKLQINHVLGLYPILVLLMVYSKLLSLFDNCEFNNNHFRVQY